VEVIPSSVELKEPITVSLMHSVPGREYGYETIVKAFNQERRVWEDKEGTYLVNLMAVFAGSISACLSSCVSCLCLLIIYMRVCLYGIYVELTLNLISLEFKNESHVPKHCEFATTDYIQVQIRELTTLAVVSRLITDRITSSERVNRSSVCHNVTVEFPEGAVGETVNGKMQVCWNCFLRKLQHCQASYNYYNSTLATHSRLIIV
jgi:hypothetical protein